MRSGLLYLLPIGVLAGLVVLAVILARRSLANGAALLTPRRLVEGYLFSVFLVTMLLASSGIADLTRAAIARMTGLEVSYRPQPVFDESRKSDEPQPLFKPKYEYDSKAPRRDYLSGSAYLSVGIILGMLHLLALRRLGRSESLASSPVYRLFLIIGLVIYTIAVLVFAVGSVRDLLLYRYAELPPVSLWYERPVPGDEAAGLAGYLPFWGYLVARFLRYAQPHATPS